MHRGRVLRGNNAVHQMRARFDTARTNRARQNQGRRPLSLYYLPPIQRVEESGPPRVLAITSRTCIPERRSDNHAPDFSDNAVLVQSHHGADDPTAHPQHNGANTVSCACKRERVARNLWDEVGAPYRRDLRLLRLSGRVYRRDRMVQVRQQEAEARWAGRRGIPERLA